MQHGRKCCNWGESGVTLSTAVSLVAKPAFQKSSRWLLRGKHRFAADAKDCAGGEALRTMSSRR